ncbi:MAG: hypothetical protein K2W96_19215, partial [Gemmataceae bacterium]|nr:hypothetical protein [Gemmataceae bacterium]
AEKDPQAAALRGAALVRAGDGLGKGLLLRGRLLPLGDEAMRYALAERFLRAGMEDEALAERGLLSRVGETGRVYQSNSLSSMATAHVRAKRHAEAAYCYRRMMANMAFGNSGTFINARAHLFVPAWAHLYGARARIDAGDPAGAEAEAREYWRYLPEEGIGAEVVRAYDKAGKKEEADRLFRERFALAQRASAEAPGSAERHNRAAWLSARCGRKLDVGLRHALRQAALAPKAAGGWDTLAEVRFQRGEKDEALKAIAEAIRLAPDRKYYEAQKKRIEAGDPKADLPATR